MMTKTHTVPRIFLCAGLLLIGSLPTWADHRRDAKAEELAHTVMQAMGGEKAWYAAHFVRFDFKVNAGGKMVVDRSHLWDKMTGRYRLDEKTKDGKLRVVLFNVGDRKGSAYVDGKKLEGAAGAKAVKDAYEAFINDMYWLAMPWKWLDPGVNLEYLGPKTRGNEAGEMVRLTFDHVGLTPGDRYDAFVSSQSHMMTHWDYKLQDGDKGSWDWQYGDYGGIKLAKNHTGAKMSIDMGDVRVMDQLDDAFFADAKRALSELK
jgi:hypothetical protein